MADASPPSMLNFGERLGLFVTFESAIVSAIPVAIVLIYVSNGSFKYYRARRKADKLMSEEWLNVWQMMAIQATLVHKDGAGDNDFFFSLMLAELIKAVGTSLNIRWMHDTFVTETRLCTAQGVLNQLGNLGVALMSLCIALHAFCILVLRFHLDPSIHKYIIAVIFLFIALMQGVAARVRGHHSGPYFSSTGFWCEIGSQYKKEQIAFEYAWLWFAAFAILLLLGITIAGKRGILAIGDGSRAGSRDRVRLHWHGRQEVRQAMKVRDNEDATHQEWVAINIANLLLLHPIVYLLCIFPSSLVHWLELSNHITPPAATIYTNAIFTLSGLLNSIIYFVNWRKPAPEKPKRSDEDGTEQTDDAPGPTHSNHLYIPDEGDATDVQTAHPSAREASTEDVSRLWQKYAESSTGYAYFLNSTAIGRTAENISLHKSPSTTHNETTRQAAASPSRSSS